MKITVIGAGAVGGYFGARLVEAGVDVTFLVREGRYKQISTHGFKVRSVNGDFEIKAPHLVTNPADIDQTDLVLLSVKGYHLNKVYPTLERLVEKGAKIVPLLNGVEHYQQLTKRFGKENVIGGLCFIIVTLDDYGYIIQTSTQHKLVFGPLHPTQQEICQQFEAVAKHANIQIMNTDHILDYIWNKYAFITAYSGLTTAARMPIGPIRESEATVQLFKDVVSEMEELAKVSGAKVGDHFVEKITKQIFDLPYESTSSMHQDLMKGYTLEVEHLHGGAIRLAKEKGISISKIEVLYGLLKLFEKGSHHEMVRN